MKIGAIDDKLIGGGGCLLIQSIRNTLRHAIAKVGLEEVRFRFDFEGTKVILS